MSKNLLISWAIGVVCVIAAVAGVLYMQRGAHLDLPGQFLKVRTAPLDDNAALAAIDFRFTNTSSYVAVVGQVKVYCEEKNGDRLDGQVLSQVDTKGLFEVMPILGQIYNPTLLSRDNVPARATWDRMAAARIEISEAKLQDRKSLIISIEEADGGVFEIRER